MMLAIWLPKRKHIDFLCRLPPYNQIEYKIINETKYITQHAHSVNL